MKHFFINIKYLPLVFLLWIGISLAQEEPIDGMAAIVGDKIILKSDASQYLNMSIVQQGLNPQTDMDKILILQNNIIQNLIDQMVVLEMAILDSIEIEDKNVDRALDQRIDGFIAQLGGEEAVEQALGQSIRTYKREFWYDMRDMLIADTYRQQIMAGISIGRKDTEAFYATYKDSIPAFPSMASVRHLIIKIKPGEDETEKTIKLLKELRENILDGADFELLAKEYSQDPGSSQNGGSLGFVRRGNLVPEFEAVAFTLNPGEISEPVKTVFGYHIIETQEILGDKIKVRHILLSPQTTDEDDSRAYKQALSLKDSIKTVEDFIQMAGLYSEDEKTKETGGSLGWINPAQYPIPQIGAALNQIQEQICAGPVNSELGYHLLWINSIRPGGKASLEEHWTEIEAMALNQKTVNWYNKWLLDARQKVFIKILN